MSVDDQDVDPPPKQHLAKDAIVDNYYTLRVVKETRIPKFQTTATHYKVDFKDFEVRELSDILKTLKRLFQSLFENITEFMEPFDLVRLSVECPELDFPITPPFMKVFKGVDNRDTSCKWLFS